MKILRFMKHAYIILCFAVLLFSCNNQLDENNKQFSANTKTHINTDTNNNTKIIEFEVIAEQFIKAFNKKDTSTLNNFINNNTGVFILQNPGAFINVEHFTSFTESKKNNGIFDNQLIRNLKIECNLEKGKKPSFSCETNKWDKQGCFCFNSIDIPVIKYYDAYVNFVLQNKENTEITNKVIKISETMTHGIYATNPTIGFYFGLIRNKWYVLCIDHISLCSA